MPVRSPRAVPNLDRSAPRLFGAKPLSHGDNGGIVSRLDDLGGEKMIIPAHKIDAILGHPNPVMRQAGDEMVARTEAVNSTSNFVLLRQQ